jgi:putative ABC transport system permease protein
MGALKRGMLNALRNPLRLILVVGVLGTSLMFVATMAGLNGNAQQQLTQAYQEIGTGMTVVPAGTGGNGSSMQVINSESDESLIPNKVVDQARNTAGVTSVEEHLNQSKEKQVTTLKGDPLKVKFPATNSGGGDVKISTPSGDIPASVNGISVDAKYFTLGINKDIPEVVDGRRFGTSDKESNVAMMGKEMAALNNLHVGDQFLIAGERFTLIGLFTSQEISTNMGVVIPIKTMQKLLKLDGVQSLTAYAKDYGSVKAVSEKIRALVEKYGYDVIAQDTMFQNVINSLETTQQTVILGLALSIGISVVVIIFAVILVVRERGTEIGVLRAIGASHWQVIRQFWLEITTMSGIAAVFAAVFLVLLGPILSNNFKISDGMGSAPAMNSGGISTGSAAPVMIMASSGSNPMDRFQLGAVTLNLQTLLVILGLGIVLAMLSSAIPAWYVARLRPAEVLRRNNL